MAKHRIAVMQRAVADSLQKTEVSGPLAERDTIDALDDFLRLQGVQDQERTRTKKLLCSRAYARRPSRSGHPLPNQDDSATLELEQDDREIEEIAI